MNYNFRSLNESFETILLNDTSSLLNHVAYDNNRPTVLVVHGYTENYRRSDSTSQILAEAYLDRGDHNILLIDWALYAHDLYFTEAVPNAYKIGVIIGKTLIAMNDEGFKVENFHLIGLSLGCHLAGFIGRSVKRFSQGSLQISRITALEAASPGFYTFKTSLRKPLNQNDGKRPSSVFMYEIKYFYLQQSSLMSSTLMQHSLVHR